MPRQPTRDPMINNDEEYVKGIAKREGALKPNGDINKTWAKAKIKKPRTRAATKEALKNYLG